MKPALLFALAALAVSCSSRTKLERAQDKLDRLIENNPGLLTHDTIVVTDTVYLEGVEADTVQVLLPGDTLYIDRDRLHVKVVKMPGDSVYVQAVCDSIFVPYEVRVPCSTVQPVKEVQVVPWWLWLMMVALCLALASSIFKR